LVLRDQVGDVFADVEKVNHVYPMQLKVIAWTDEYREPTYFNAIGVHTNKVCAVLYNSCLPKFLWGVQHADVWLSRTERRRKHSKDERLTSIRGTLMAIS
jgi:hypothetical protein